MRAAKTIKIFLNWFLGPLLFAGLAFSIFQQIRHQPRLAQSWLEIKESFFSHKLLYLVFAVVLLTINWGLEAWKWRLLVNTVRPVTFASAYKAVLSGVSFSVALPYRTGEYIGRMVYQPEGGRLKTISLAIVGSTAQLLVTLIAGCFGLIVLKQALLLTYPQLTIWFQFLLYGLMFMTGLITLIYFRVSTLVKIFSRWLIVHRWLYLVESLQNFNAPFLSRLLLLSFIRYTVFVLQYIAVFYFFGVSVSAVTVVWVMGVVFLALAVIPSIALIELGLRGEVSLRLMGMFSANGLGIGLTSVTVWFLNLIVPAAIGALLLLNIKWLSKNNEAT